jgi:hypothetical protein
MRVRLISLGLVACVTAWMSPAIAQQATSNATVTHVKFNLIVNTPFLSCLQASTKTPPTATVTVIQGNLNDTLTIKVQHMKPKLAFDMFTVQNSPFLADGTADSSFPGNFGLAWYQSDLQMNSAGNGSATIKTIIVDQIFGFDAGSGIALTPTNTFHVGFWFANPADAAACGFTGTTPFNGEHAAGPLAMISGTNATTQLGPLCLNPSDTPGTCNN